MILSGQFDGFFLQPATINGVVQSFQAVIGHVDE